MKKQLKQARLISLAVAAVLALIAGVGAAALLDDTFADSNSQNQDLANNSLRLFNGRANTVRTDAIGSATFDITNAGGSEAFWAFFTNAGQPVTLGVGDKLTVALTFSLTGFQANGADIRFGVLDSMGTRNANNLTGGMNDATFVNDTGYGVQFYASGQGAPFVIGRRAVLSGGNPFNNFGDFPAITTGASGATERQALANDVAYTLSYTIERSGETETRIAAAVTGSGLNNLNYAVIERGAAPETKFDYFGFRVAGPTFATRFKFTRLLVDYTPAAPVITAQPQPANLTVQVGSNVTLAVGASGRALTYQWQKDGQALTGNASALTPVLNLSNVQTGDAGRYVCVVSNAGGSVSSNAAVLQVSSTPVPPAPRITAQPANTTATLGSAAILTVTAAGEGLVYQWFKDGALLAGATNAALTIARAALSDAGNYTVVVSNTSGSVTSAAAVLTVVSALQAVSLAPVDTGICIDAPLTLTFDQDVRVGRSGRIRVYQENGQDDGTLVDTLDLSSPTQSKPVGGSAFNYYPVLVSGRTATIYLRRALENGRGYYVTLEPGVLTDASDAPFAGFSDPSRWRFSTLVFAPPLGATSLTVATDGSGDFCTVQAAIDFVPAGNTRRVVITVRAGIYNEIVYVASNKPFITVRGESREQSIIQYANNANVNAGNARAMFGVDAADFTLETITLVNTTPRGGSQAEAFRGNNQRILLDRVTLKSFQDTLLLQGNAFVTDSYIEGDVDFMWGGGAVFFQRCELRAVTAGYYTQIRNPQGRNGNVYVNCRLTGAPGVTNVYLSRIDPNVFPYSQVIFINNALGPHILPVGWQLNNATVAPNVQFWEYGSTDPEGAPLNVGQRLNVSRQLTAEEAKQWSDPAFVLGGWRPHSLSASPSVVFREQTITAHWSAPSEHAATDWVGMFRAGDADAQPLAKQEVSAASFGGLQFTTPAQSGQYEFRYFRADGMKLATSNAVVAPPAPLRVRRAAPIGFASVNALGQDGTTGGAGGATVTVTTAQEFMTAVARKEPLVIRVNGLLTLPRRMVDVTSDKTILGVGAQSGFTGGGLTVGPDTDDNATEPPAVTVKNVILRNLIFTDLPDDAINIQGGAHHVWIDHCDLSKAYDGLIDIRLGASYVTVSWNRLSEHSKTSLVGSDDSNGPLDIGRLRVTFHHNFFDGTVQRNPRVRFGEPVHIFNNFYLNNIDVGVACFMNSGCLVEGNYFDGLRLPITIQGPTEPGRAVERNNVYVRSGAPVVGGAVREPGEFYRYTLDNPAQIKAIVMLGAGVGKLNF